MVYRFKHKAVQIIPLGDFHIGTKQHMQEEFRRTIQYAKDHSNCYLILMGDMMDNITRSSVGEIFEQTIPPQEQVEAVIDELWDVRKKILWLHQGNHEERSMREAGVDSAKYIADVLGVPYEGYFVKKPKILDVRGERYTIYSTHGYSGATSYGGKVNVIKKLAGSFDADIYLMGHVHDLIIIPQTIKTSGQPRTRYFVITGHYTAYGGYAQKKGYEAGLTGSPLITLSGREHRINVQSGIP